MGEERVVPGGDEEFRHAPYVFFRGHPMLRVQAGEVDGTRVGAKGSLAAKIVVVIEVAEGQFAQGAIYRRAKAKAGEVGFGDAAPKSILAKDGEDVVIIVDGFEVKEKRRIAVHAESCRGHESPFQAVPLALAQYFSRRPCGVGILIGNVVDELLDLRRGIESTKGAEIFRAEAVGRLAVPARSVLGQALGGGHAYFSPSS